MRSARRRQDSRSCLAQSGRNRRLKRFNFVKLAQTGDIFLPQVAAMFTVARMVVEPGVRTAAAVAWKAPPKRLLTLYLCCNSRWYCRSRLQVPVLQQQISDAAAAAAAAACAMGVAAAEGGSGPPVETEATGVARWCGKIGRVVGM